MHKKLENSMSQFGVFIHENPFKVLFVVLFLLAFPISHVPQIKMDTSTEGFMHPDDPVLLTYNKFREQFGRDERIVLAIQSDSIFSIHFLEKLKKLHKEIESKVPFVEEVTSLYNVRNTRGEGDKLLTDDLLQPFPSNEKEVAEIKKRALQSHFYKDLFLNQEGDMTTLIIETDVYSHEGEQQVSLDDAFSDGFDEPSEETTSQKKEFLSDGENHILLGALKEIMKKYEADDFKMYLAGSPVVNNELKAQMKADMQKFMRITFLIILVFLFLIFRRLSAVVYPLLVITLSLLATVGAMAWSGSAFKLPTQIVPALLLSVSVGATVHILSVFFDKFNATGDKKEAIVFTLGHSGLAIAMTSVTTAIGVGSFAGSEVAPISDLGIYASLGVMISLVLTLTLLPALLSITRLQVKQKAKKQIIDTWMKKLASIPINYTKEVLIGAFVIVFLALAAASQVHLSHNPLQWFQAQKDTRIATELIDKKMHGTVTIEVVVDTGEVNGWHNPERLAKLDSFSKKMQAYTDEYTHVGKVVSLATIMKETNRALHENKEAYYVVPHEADLISQELLLFENSGSDDLEDVVDTQFSKTRITIKLPWLDSIYATKILKYVQDESKQTFNDSKVSVTGMVPLLINTFSHAVYSSAFSYLLAGVAITFMMMLILGSVRMGLLSMIPNLVPIVMGLLVMYAGGMPLDMFTLLIGSIAIGLAVDDTIHFMHNFRRYYLETNDAAKAIEHTFYSTGKAMLITTLVLSLGFYAYMAANMISVQNFGIITGSVIVFALVSDLILAPALMIVAANRGWVK